MEHPIAGSIGHRVALKHAVKKDNPRVVWQQLRCHNGDRVSDGGSHKGRSGDKAAKVCDVRVQKDSTPCHPSACPACEYTLCDSRGRREGNKGGGCAVGVGRQAFVDTTGDGNGFTRLKSLAHQRYAAADSGIERRVIEEHPRRVLVSDRRRTSIGALFETHSGHTPRCTGIGAVNGGRVSAIHGNNTQKKNSLGVCWNERLKNPIAVE